MAWSLNTEKVRGSSPVGAGNFSKLKESIFGKKKAQAGHIIASALILGARSSIV